MKKFFAILMTLALMLSLAVPASATETETKGTIVNGTDRLYKAYQIFKGTQASNSAVLGDIGWGDGINVITFLPALKNLEVGTNKPFASCETANDVANVLKDAQDMSAIANAFANLAENHVDDTKGIDIAGGATANINSGYYVLIDQTSLDNDTTTNLDAYRGAALLQVTNGSNLTITNKGDKPEIEKKVNDKDTDHANIGDTVTFTLTATLPSTFEGYEAYKLVFHDTMSEGLTYTGDTSVSVKVGNTTLTAGQYTVDSSVNKETGVTTLTVTISDVLVHKPAISSDVVVTYTATLNDNAVIGSAGNPNEVVLEYSNDPQSDGTGKTPKDEVKVFTWEIPVFKYTGTDTPLAGAGFTLYTDADCKTAVNVVEMTRKVVEGEITKNVTFYQVCTKNDSSETHKHITEIITNTTGKFEIEGLKPGTYYLKETTTPAGYNSLTAPIKVVIAEDGKLTQDNTPATEIGIQNNAGATLPETGGMGTTIFYIVGGVMVVAAVVLLVTKKRMSAEG